MVKFADDGPELAVLRGPRRVVAKAGRRAVPEHFRRLVLALHHAATGQGDWYGE